jgi:hypothetical protein
VLLLVTPGKLCSHRGCGGCALPARQWERNVDSSSGTDAGAATRFLHCCWATCSSWPGCSMLVVKGCHSDHCRGWRAPTLALSES